MSSFERVARARVAAAVIGGDARGELLASFTSRDGVRDTGGVVPSRLVVATGATMACRVCGWRISERVAVANRAEGEDSDAWLGVLGAVPASDQRASQFHSDADAGIALSLWLVALTMLRQFRSWCRRRHHGRGR